MAPTHEWTWSAPCPPILRVPPATLNAYGDQFVFKTINEIQGQSQNHVRNVLRTFGTVLQDSGNPRAALAAPSAEQFRTCLRHFRTQCLAVAQPCEGVGAKHKLAKMRWCLAEAARFIWRVELRNAMAINILRDERHGRLLIRFRSCSDDIDLHVGVIGQARNFPPSSIGITNATMGQIELFCTPLSNPPYAHRDHNPEPCDNDLVEVIRTRCLGVTTDAAENEVASIRDMQTPSAAQHAQGRPDQGLLPNSIIIRDKTHGARRVSWQ
jgi:hypothetical protein